MTPPVIKLKNIGKTYSNGKVEVEALRSINLEIGQGEFVAIMGSSGSGKSTLMNIIGCLDTQSRGDYLLDGTDIMELETDGKAEIRSTKIGFVFQSFNLLPRTTALENVELPLVYSAIAGAKRKKLASAALALVGLGQRADHLPNQLSGRTAAESSDSEGSCKRPEDNTRRRTNRKSGYGHQLRDNEDIQGPERTGKNDSNDNARRRHSLPLEKDNKPKGRGNHH